MRSLPLAGVLATAAVAGGAGLIGASVGGMAKVDHELAAATGPAPVARLNRVVYVPRSVACPPVQRRHRVDARPEL